MSDIRLTVREAERDWSGIVHYSIAELAIAALSADPVTLPELELAVTRFEELESQERLQQVLKPGLVDEPYDAGLCLIDLAARLVLNDSSASSPGPTGYVCYDDEKRGKEVGIRYHLADDWLFTSDRFSWRALADQRRAENAVTLPQDIRAGVYGRPLLEHIARAAYAAYPREAPIIAPAEIDPFDSPDCKTIRQIHADWLMTPRADLGDRSPREILLSWRSHISWDLQDRCDQWSLQGKCPPPLEKTSHAYVHGGFGIHELVMYYYLVRELIWSSWDRLADLVKNNQLPSVARDDFLLDELPRLEAKREAWLDEPDPEYYLRTPRSIIDKERARIPEVMSKHESIIDPDCPCCQMNAELPGPMFWCLDGCNMDDEFAFSIFYRTKQEWDEEQRSYEEFNKKFDAEQAERKRMGLSDTGPDGKDAVWSRSFMIDTDATLPLGIRLFGIGGHLASIIVSLREGKEAATPQSQAQAYIDQLNRCFGNLREVLLGDASDLNIALMEPVVNRMRESLDEVAEYREDLSTQCEWLGEELERVLKPAPASTSTDDEGIPF